MNQHPHAHTEEKVTFGFWVYLMSDCVLFASLFAAYVVLQDQTFGSPSISELASIPFVLVETLILLTSSFVVGLSVHFARRAHTHSTQGGRSNIMLPLGALLGTLALGAAFLSMEVYEFVHLVAEGHGPWANAAYSAFFTLVGTHGLHVFVGVLWGVVLAAQLWLWGSTTTVVRRLVCFSLFWHFLDIIWIFIFTFVYLFGALS